MSRIVCRESDYDHTASNGQYYGLGQLNQADVAAHTPGSAGTATSMADRRLVQVLATLRYCKAVYGDATSAWSSEVNRCS